MLCAIAMERDAMLPCLLLEDDCWRNGVERVNFE